MKGYFVYMFLNEKEEPLYIGLSTNLTTRIEVQHFKSSNGNLSQECINETYKILYHSALSADDMKIKERYLINILNPKYNSHMNKDSKFSFTIDIDWKLYSIDKENLTQSRDIKIKRTRIGNAFFFKPEEIQELFINYPNIDDDERLRHGVNEKDYFYLIEYKKKWFIWSREIEWNDNLITSWEEINHINDFDERIVYNEDYIKEKFKRNNYLFVKSEPFGIFGEYYYYGGKGERNILNPKKRLFLEYNFYKKKQYVKAQHIEQIDEIIFEIKCKNKTAV